MWILVFLLTFGYKFEDLLKKKLCGTLNHPPPAARSSDILSKLKKMVKYWNIS